MVSTSLQRLYCTTAPTASRQSPLTVFPRRVVLEPTDEVHLMQACGTLLVPPMGHMAPGDLQALTTERAVSQSSSSLRLQHSMGRGNGSSSHCWLPRAAAQPSHAGSTHHPPMPSASEARRHTAPDAYLKSCRGSAHVLCQQGPTCTHTNQDSSGMPLCPPFWSCARWHLPSRRCRSLRGLSGTAQASPWGRTRR